ncbi:hypothetical protein HDU83_003865 [Entophlyctis luteolus]|nr:hypothetical protein HDU82_007781 [Entophlyctis luteolus]KAJ3345650.1 hypothetical protein HDU83_003865 [Entophlyctis luteolus]
MIRPPTTEITFEAGPETPLPTGRIRRRRRRSSYSFVGSPRGDGDSSGHDDDDDADDGDFNDGNSEHRNVFGGAADIVTQPLIPTMAQVQRIFGGVTSQVHPAVATPVLRPRQLKGENADSAAGAFSATSIPAMNAGSAGTVGTETPLQTLRRLLFETKELVSDILAATPPAPPPAASIASKYNRTTPASVLEATAARVETQLELLHAQQTNLEGTSLAQAEALRALKTHITHAKENRLPPPRQHMAPSDLHPQRSYAAVAAHRTQQGHAQSAHPSSSSLLSPSTPASPGASPLSPLTAFPHSNAPPHVRAPSLSTISTTAAPQPITNTLQYDLYYQANPSGAGIGSSTLFADDFFEIERRVAVLERLVGLNGTTTASTTGAASNDTTAALALSQSASTTQAQLQLPFGGQTILDEISDLDSTLTLLTTPHALARLSRRIQTMTSQMQRTVNLRRRIIADQEKQERRRARLSSSLSMFDSSSASDSEDRDSNASSEDDGGGGVRKESTPRGDAAVAALVDHEMEQRRAEDEKRVGYLFSTLNDRLDPMAATIPLLLQRLKGLKILNSEISGTTVRETLNEIENEQAGVIGEKVEKVKNGIARIRVNIRQGAKIAHKRFEGIEKGVNELVNVIDVKFGSIPREYDEYADDDEYGAHPASMPVYVDSEIAARPESAIPSEGGFSGSDGVVVTEGSSGANGSGMYSSEIVSGASGSNVDDRGDAPITGYEVVDHWEQ